MASDTRIHRGLVLLAALLLLAGCQPLTVEDSLTSKLGGSEPEQQMEFWHALTDRPMVSHDDAFRATLLFLDGKDDTADYAARVDLLKQRGLLAKKFERPANEAITRGTLAVVLVKALEIRGGVVMRLTGASPRYALRELVYMNLYPPSSPHQYFTGTELVGVFGRMEDYQRAQAARAPADAEPQN